MEHVPAILEAMARLGFSPMWVIVLIMMYFMGANTGAFPKFWSKQQEKTEDIPVWAQHLIQHFNHDTTSQHDETHLKLENIKKDTEKIIAKTEEWDKYGIKTR